MIDLNKLNYVRLEFSDGKSNKFWSLTKDSMGTWAATWGKIGAGGTATQATQYTQSIAQKKVHEKIAKGYKLVTGHERKPTKKEASAIDFKKLMEEL